MRPAKKMTAAIGIAAGMGREATAVLSTLLALGIFTLMPLIIARFEPAQDPAAREAQKAAGESRDPCSRR
jgi:putative Mg2+ transporter-C (MgtC) family protein